MSSCSIRHHAGKFQLVTFDSSRPAARQLDLLLFANEQAGGQVHFVNTKAPQSITAFRTLSVNKVQFETMLEQPTGRWELVQGGLCTRIKALPDVQTIFREELQRNQKCRPFTDAMAARRAQNREHIIDDVRINFLFCDHVIRPIGA